MRRFGLNVAFSTGMGLAVMASAEENASPPEKAAPAVTVSSLPQDIQLIVGMSGEDYYQPRMDAIHAVMARRKDSSETVIAITILTANLIRWKQEAARLLFCPLPAICWRGNIGENNEVYRMAA